MDREYLKFLYVNKLLNLNDLNLAMELNYIGQSDYEWIVKEE